MAFHITSKINRTTFNLAGQKCPAFILTIMCLYPRLVPNPKYLPNKKNGGNPPICTDYRKLYVPIGCGNCIECRKQKAQSWRLRLCEELKRGVKAYFVTVTFSNEIFEEFSNILKTEEPNLTATFAVRRFLERWRKKYKKSLRHWFVSELGQEASERLHLHGIIFTSGVFNKEILTSFWKYGRTDVGEYCNQRTINYIVKYITKVDFKHKGYIPVILCSAGIGSNYAERPAALNKHKFRGKDTIEYYTLDNGYKCALPIYLRNKFYNEDEREELWINKLDKHIRYIRGLKCKIDTEKGMQEYFNLLKEQQRINEELGYGNLSKEWKRKNYKTRLKEINVSDGKDKIRFNIEKV